LGVNRDGYIDLLKKTHLSYESSKSIDGV